MKFIHLIAQNVAWVLIKFLLSTWKFERINTEYLEEAKRYHPKGSHLQACWHEHLLSFSTSHANTFPYLTMVSRSQDGDYASYLAKKLGFIAVRGSSKKAGKDKGGKAAMDLYIAKMPEGFPGGITVDGPRGPRRVSKPGVVVIAQQTGTMIVPGITVTDRYWEFNSWDRLKIPKFFARVKVIYGKPFAVPATSTAEQIEVFCKKLDADLAQLEATA